MTYLSWRVLARFIKHARSFTTPTPREKRPFTYSLTNDQNRGRIRVPKAISNSRNESQSVSRTNLKCTHVPGGFLLFLFFYSFACLFFNGYKKKKKLRSSELWFWGFSCLFLSISADGFLEKLAVLDARRMSTRDRIKPRALNSSACMASVKPFGTLNKDCAHSRQSVKAIKR